MMWLWIWTLSVRVATQNAYRRSVMKKSILVVLGCITLALSCISVPILAACSFLLNWPDGIQVLLVFVTVAEFILLEHMFFTSSYDDK